MMELPEEIIIKILKLAWNDNPENFEAMASTCNLIRRISRDKRFTDCFKCEQCKTIDMALQADHLTCYKWHYNKMIKPDIDLLFIDASKKKSGSLKIVKYLVLLGANIHENHDYAIQLASINGHLEVVKFLVSLGADIHETNDLAVRWASEHGHLEVVKFLVESGANIHAKDDYAVLWASKNYHSEVVKYLVSKGAKIPENTYESKPTKSKKTKVRSYKGFNCYNRYSDRLAWEHNH